MIPWSKKMILNWGLLEKNYGFMDWWVLVPDNSSRVLVPRYWFPGTIHGDTECWYHTLLPPETMPKWRDPGLAQKVHRMHPNDSFPRQFWRAFKTTKSCIQWSKILYYLRLAQPRNQINNAIQGDHCVLETAVRKPLCYDTMIQNIILPQISSAQKSN